jgi:hypothetical protein
MKTTAGADRRWRRPLRIPLAGPVATGAGVFAGFWPAPAALAARLMFSPETIIFQQRPGENCAALFPHSGAMAPLKLERAAEAVW